LGYDFKQTGESYRRDSFLKSWFFAFFPQYNITNVNEYLGCKLLDCVILSLFWIIDDKLECIESNSDIEESDGGVPSMSEGINVIGDLMLLI
jgi:hypothetical protein